MIRNLQKHISVIEVIPLVLTLMVFFSGIITIFTYSVGLNYYDGFDYLEDVYWAKATLESGALVHPEYNYVYIIPFGANLIMAPFVAVFGVSLIANQLGMIVYFLLYLSILYYFSSSIFDDHSERLYCVSIVSLFIYTLVGDGLLHHILAYGIGFVCLLGELGSIIHIYKNEGKLIRHYILLVLFSLWASLNGLGVVGLANLIVLISTVAFLYLKRIRINQINFKGPSYIYIYI